MNSYCENHPDHIELRDKGIIIASVILGPLAIAVVVARTWLRAVVQKNVDISDWMMVVGSVCGGNSGLANRRADQA